MVFFFFVYGGCCLVIEFCVAICGLFCLFVVVFCFVRVVSAGVCCFLV